MHSQEKKSTPHVLPSQWSIHFHTLEASKQAQASFLLPPKSRCFSFTLNTLVFTPSSTHMSNSLVNLLAHLPYANTTLIHIKMKAQGGYK